jgi:hypothetical protein
MLSTNDETAADNTALALLVVCDKLTGQLRPYFIELIFVP